MSNFDDVKKFCERIGYQIPRQPGYLTDEMMNFRINAMAEELDELREAYEEGRLDEIIDALIDLSYFAMGTAALMGIDWEIHWMEVHEANMKKFRGKTKRQFAGDAAKPSDWVPPNHAQYLNDEKVVHLHGVATDN